ncbi:hypothetical protein CEXT_533311 [Caerostris extrusa]|uniref:Transmembrane protein n=1 Tax=Caerostris extrusa TaxID=172846 RepID=A0AAV4PKQ4_CAEEX|nr:hypothetical protein CEXT_533311 [Caerostris extrusa]
MTNASKAHPGFIPKGIATPLSPRGLEKLSFSFNCTRNLLAQQSRRRDRICPAMRGALLRIALFVHRVTFLGAAVCILTLSWQPWSVFGHRMRVKERVSLVRTAPKILFFFLHFKVLWMADDINCFCLYLLQHSFNTMYK